MHDYIQKVCEHYILITTRGNFTKFAMNWIDFEVKRSRSHQDLMWSDKEFWRHLSAFSRMHGNILMKLITVTHRQVHMTMMTFSGSSVQRSKSWQHFLNMYFSGGGMPICCLPSSTVWFLKNVPYIIFGLLWLGYCRWNGVSAICG